MNLGSVSMPSYKVWTVVLCRDTGVHARAVVVHVGIRE